MSLWRWLVGSDALENWTPQRAQAAEHEMLRRDGHVVEPHYLWSKPAKARERQAQMNRERRQKLTLVTRPSVARWKQGAK